MKKFRNYLLIFVACLLTFLTGCVRYDVGVNFPEQHQGQIIQQIALGQQLTSLSQSEVNKWLNSIDGRAAQLQGKVKRLSSQEILVTIPFSNGQELVRKFNQFFNPTPAKATQSTQPDNLDLIQLKSEMSLRQSNWLFLEQNRLSLSVDLRALGVLSNQGNIIVSPGDLIDLKFSLNAPLWAAIPSNKNVLTPEISEEGHRLVWQLQPGQINQIEAVFWVPSWLGLGSLGIILLMLAGFYLKYGHFPGVVRADTASM
jgi:hypothetical protein